VKTLESLLVVQFKFYYSMHFYFRTTFNRRLLSLSCCKYRSEYLLCDMRTARSGSNGSWITEFVYTVERR